MKIDRLIGILSILLQKEKVTAPYLAEKFEVSRRTINRDIETLCSAGIPIYTTQGANGGISIIENYKFDRTILSEKEMRDILAGLQSLDSIDKSSRYTQLMEKLYADSSGPVIRGQSILIDLSSWNKDKLSYKIELIRNAIETNHKISFLYFSPDSEQQRIVEPYYLVFHWSSWYLWGFCDMRKDFRLFKLNRMTSIQNTSHEFKKDSKCFPDFKNENIFSGGINIKVLFKENCKWRLIEEFGSDAFKTMNDGTILFQTDFTNKENLFTWLMTFGDSAELLEPIEIRKEFLKRINKIKNIYEKEI